MGNIVYQKHCEWCGCAFTAQKGSTRYCSHTCASRAYKARTRAGLAQQQEQQFKQEEEQKRLKSFDRICVMSPRLAAEYLGIGKSTIYRYIESGQLKALKLSRKTLIRKEDLDSLFSLNPEPLHASAMKKRDDSSPKEKKPFKTDDYYTSRQLMELTGMSLNGVHKLMAREKVRQVLRTGVAYFRKKDVDPIVQKRKEESHPEISQWYTTTEILQKFGLTRPQVYSIAYDHAVPSKVEDRQKCYSKLHFDAVMVSRKSRSSEGAFYTIDEIMAKYSLTRSQADCVRVGWHIRFNHRI